jgi:hypothetical protein
MPTAIFRYISPEEFELAHRRKDLASLREILADRELALAHLRDQLFSFEARYIRQVGVLYKQLDEWEERLAELRVSRETLEERDNARAAFRKANPDYDPSAPDAADIEIIITTHEIDLKLLFHELAKRIHPDFAINHQDAHRRHQLMAQANEAYRRDDAAVLQRMLDGYDASGETFGRYNAAEELRRTKTLIQSVTADTETVNRELTDLAQSELAQLREETMLAAAEGRDHLAEMAARVKGMIGNAMRHFEYESSPRWRRPVVADPESLLTAEVTPTRPPVFQRFR